MEPLVQRVGSGIRNGCSPNGNRYAGDVNAEDPTTEIWSELDVASVQGRSRAVTCTSRQPLKILNPGSPNDCCYAVLSSYGGGLVQGDRVNLRITCRAGTSLYLATQANTRVYKNPEGRPTTQFVAGRLEGDAMVVVNPDPVVPHAGSRFHQVQEWELDREASLVLVDWFHSGRMESGERFSYGAYRSDIRVSRDGTAVLMDRLESCPGEASPEARARFGPYHTLMNIYLLGARLDELTEGLATQFGNPEQRTIRDVRETGRSDGPLPRRLVSVNAMKRGGTLVRALGINRDDLQPVRDRLFDLLAGSELLGFNPLLRKY